MPPLILRIAVPSPLPQLFDYLPPPHCQREQLRPGVRVRVPFGRTHRIGILLEIAEHSALTHERLKVAEAILDEVPLLATEQLELALWASRYYHYPVGEVLAAQLPVLLRQGQPARLETLRGWYATAAGLAVNPATLTRAPRQMALLAFLQRHSEGVLSDTLDAELVAWRPALRALTGKGWVEAREWTCQTNPVAVPAALPQLNDAHRPPSRP